MAFTTAAAEEVLLPLAQATTLLLEGLSVLTVLSGCLLYTSPSPRDRG